MVEQMDERRNNINQLWWELEIKHEESGINKIQEWRETGDKNDESRNGSEHRVASQDGRRTKKKS